MAKWCNLLQRVCAKKGGYLLEKKHSTTADTVIEFKEGRTSDVVCLVFIICLVVFCSWLIFRLGHENELFGWFLILIWTLCIYFPISNIRNPKSFSLLIDGDMLFWRIRASEGEASEEQRIPVRQISALELVMPAVDGDKRSRHPSLGQVFLVMRNGHRHEIPPAFFPGIHWIKIATALKQLIPELRVTERVG